MTHESDSESERVELGGLVSTKVEETSWARERFRWCKRQGDTREERRGSGEEIKRHARREALVTIESVLATGNETFSDASNNIAPARISLVSCRHR